MTCCVQAKNALANLGHWASQYDADGIDIYFLNAQVGRGYAKCNLRVRHFPHYWYTLLIPKLRPRKPSQTRSRMCGLMAGHH